jgi:hypothetical protein
MRRPVARAEAGTVSIDPGKETTVATLSVWEFDTPDGADRAEGALLALQKKPRSRQATWASRLRRELPTAAPLTPLTPLTPRG